MSGQNQASTGGLDPNVGGLLSYLLFGWVGGLIMYFTQKDPEVRFHGAQSVLVSLAWFAVYIGLLIVSTVSAFVLDSFAIAGLFTLLYGLTALAAFGLWVFLCVQGYQLKHTKLPVVGNLAERWAAK